MMSSLTSGERRALRARAHHLRPVVKIGDAGLTAALVREIDVNLTSHELIKIRVAEDDRLRRGQILGEICRVLDASPVQHVGKILVIFRPAPKRHGEAAARPLKIRKPARRTKRSYQMP